jgi:hypothetical protein
MLLVLVWFKKAADDCRNSLNPQVGMAHGNDAHQGFR